MAMAKNDLYKKNSNENKQNLLMNGFYKLCSPLEFQLNKNTYQECTMFMYLGLNINEKFHKQFGIEISNRPPIPIILNGNGLIPLLTILNIQRKSLKTLDKLFEYETLKNQFNTIIIKIIDNGNIIDENKFKLSDGGGDGDNKLLVEKIQLKYDNNYCVILKQSHSTIFYPNVIISDIDNTGIINDEFNDFILLDYPVKTIIYVFILLYNII